MLDIYVFILAILVIAADIFSLRIILVPLYKNKTEIVRLISFGFIFWGLAQVYAIVRYFLFFIYRYMPLFFLDVLGFIATFISVCASIMTAQRVIFILSRQSGVSANNESRMNQEKYFRVIYTIIIAIFTILVAYSFYQTEPDPYGFYMYQIPWRFYQIFSIIMIPLIVFTLYRSKLIFNRIKDKILKKQLIVFIFANIAWSFNIWFNMGFYYFIPSYLWMSAIHFPIFFSCLIFYSLLIRKYQGFLDKMSTYFCVKSIYLIKDSGQTLVSLDFQKNQSSDFDAQKELLLGGFLYAISSGLELSTELKGKLNSLEIGDTTLIIKYGKYVFGVLFVTENTEGIQENFNDFMEVFEKKYEDVFLNWTGEITHFKKEKIKKLLEPYFKFY